MRNATIGRPGMEGPCPRTLKTPGSRGAFVAEGRDPPPDAFHVRTSPVLEDRLKALAEVGAQRGAAGAPAPFRARRRSGAGSRRHGRRTGTGAYGRRPRPVFVRGERRRSDRRTGRAGGGSPQAQDRARAAEPETETEAAVRVRAGAPRRSGGEEIRLEDQEAEAAPPPSQPDGSEFVHRATREAMLDRLRGSRAGDPRRRRRRRAGGARPEKRGRRRAPGCCLDGRGWPDGRRALAVHTLLREVDRLPAAPSPRGSMAGST